MSTFEFNLDFKPMLKRLLTIPLLLLSALCFGQSTVESITHDGIQRDYRLYIPAPYDGSEQVPVVFNLHGYTSDAFQQEIYGDFRPIADTANFFLVHPQGTEDNTGTTFWNALGFPGETVDDVGFISALIDTIASEYNIDLDRVYSTGMSNGGFMSYKLACELPDRIAAIASVTGSMVEQDLNTCNPTEPIPVMQIHGTNDLSVPYSGSQGGFVGIEELVAAWANKNNCSGSPSVTAVPDIDMTDDCTSERWLYTGGDEGSTVELYKVQGGAHTWPGANPFFTSVLGITSQDFSASVEIWRFFRKYSRSGLVSVNNESIQVEFGLYPNPTEGSILLQFEDVKTRNIEVYNGVGQLLLDRVSTGKSVPLELENSGIYFVTVNEDGNRATKKLVVE